MCRSPDDEAAAFQAIARNGWLESEFFSQRWLGEGHEVFSVCGFFDATEPRRNLLMTTVKVHQYTSVLSSGSVVASVDDPAELVPRAVRILSDLGYCGPFELKFVRHADTFLVIELNPRFWLQHGIFLGAGNGVMKRYLGVESSSDWHANAQRRLLSADSLWLLKRFLHLDLAAVRTLAQYSRRGYAIVLLPGPGAFPRVLSRFLRRRIRVDRR